MKVDKAANNTKITTYGKKFLSLDLELRHEFPFIFLVVDVQKTIIGDDFLSKFNLLVNSKNQTLHDSLLLFHVVCTTAGLEPIGVHVLLPASNVFSNLSEFPAVFRAQSDIIEPKHEVRHHIITSGAPVLTKARRLHPDKLQAVKEEFQHMVSLGIV
ncbi:unnamed protein product [Hymenolepis diminuta]|uniref:Uncharacterized protein n=1 Tax=Hymenolepis diminuta TaxID=6216 RepID=A0A564YTA5_HYMDI|nr:unnamed protein product [Hymenolepis diminuta]VUZ49964.1 unnamed protein product [Hymenolepis diminuta]VUZ50455.1 unnamed protein product [Hymenolepis diminuta]